MTLTVNFTESVNLSVSFSENNAFSASLGAVTTVTDPATVPQYTGSYSVTPGEQAVTLNTRWKMSTSDITVAAIPSNYGLLTYDGNILTVS